MPKVSEILNALDQENKQAEARIQRQQQDLDQQLTNLRQGFLASLNSADSDIRNDMEGFCSRIRTSIDQLNPAMEKILQQRMAVYRKTLEQAMAKEVARVQQQSQKGQKSFLEKAKSVFRWGMAILVFMAAVIFLLVAVLGWRLHQNLTIQ